MWDEAIDEGVAAKLQANFAVGWRSPLDPDWEEFFRRASHLHYKVNTMSHVASLDVSEYAPHVTCPTLVIGRTELPSPTAAESARIAAAFPQGRLVMLAGESYAGDAESTRVLVEFFAGQSVGAVHATRPGKADPEPLSVRELEVLALIAAGRTNVEIAESLTIAPATASKHVHNILEKLGMSRRSEAAAWWASNGNGRGH